MVNIPEDDAASESGSIETIDFAPEYPTWPISRIGKRIVRTNRQDKDDIPELPFDEPRHVDLKRTPSESNLSVASDDDTHIARNEYCWVKRYDGLSCHEILEAGVRLELLDDNYQCIPACISRTLMICPAVDVGFHAIQMSSTG